MSLNTRNFECLFRTGKCPPVSQLKYIKNGHLFSKNEENGRHISSAMKLSEKLRYARYIPHSSKLKYVAAQGVEGHLRPGDRGIILPPKNVF